MVEKSERSTTVEGSGGGLLPAAEGLNIVPVSNINSVPSFTSFVLR